MHNEWLHPPAEFSLMPFWFWNDVLDTAELLRQIDDFQRHGVEGFVIHPRVGLPRDCGWMSARMLDFMDLAIEEAARRGMKVILYDEGMYPSGSSSGQVVARYPHLACRGLALHPVGQPLPSGATVIAQISRDDGQYSIVERPIDSYIRGLHYIGEGPAEDEPPAADLLNPATAAAVIELVHDVFAHRFGRHFGNTILGIFTDEPNPRGKCREKNVRPGTTGILDEVSRLLGKDFRPRLPLLWTTEPEGDAARADWQQAIRLRLNETWYRPLSEWCAAHGIALCGHPDHGDEIGAQRFFHIPGQDLVWRWVEPGKPSSTQGHESTQAKCSASAMVHLGRRRNSNEFGGAYGAQTTFDEVRSLAWWCLVRGVNLLFPHAFYYSIRGPRREERPPQIGPHTPPWQTPEFKAFADACRRLCWINTDSRPVCQVAILTHEDQCPWEAAEVLLTHQVDFHYLDPQTLLERATVDAQGISVAGLHYRRLVIDGEHVLPPTMRDKLSPLITAGRVVRWCADTSVTAETDGIIRATDPEALVAALNDPPAVRLPRLLRSGPSLRVRWVEKHGVLYGLIFNESLNSSPLSLEFADDAKACWLDPATGESQTARSVESLELKPLELKLIQYMP